MGNTDTTIDHFPKFTTIVAGNFQSLASQKEAFIVDIDGRALYEMYLDAFPEGTNPLFKEKTEYDCQCCRQFIRRVGNVVAVLKDGSTKTVWDDAAAKSGGPFNEVATILRDAVRDAPICDLFRVKEKETPFGAKTTIAQNKQGNVVKWNHLYTGKISKSLLSPAPKEASGIYRTTVDVFERGLKELKPEAIETVLALIDANNLYRGAEHRGAVASFQKAQQRYLDSDHPDRFIWAQAEGSASRFRNTVIGTLVQDLSSGVDVERAVGSFEAKVAPHNYKRTSAIITPRMIKNAMDTIEELGLEPALERRFARIDDISVNDVLWVDNAVKPLMKGGIGDMLLAQASKNRNTTDDEKRAENISMDEFVASVLPNATDMELLFKGQHLGNLVSLTAPVHPEPKQLFRWNNDFAWSYGGNVTDSIRERVKRAGGNVNNALLRVSLSWFNYDDLDIHIHEPSGSHIHYRNMHGKDGGHLDVDMNVKPTSREAVENVSWTKLSDGVYKVMVNNYTHRESIDVGFVVEIECKGEVTHFNYGKQIRNGQNVSVVKIHIKNGAIEKFEKGEVHITNKNTSQEKWGLHTENYVRINAVTLSPNFWGDNAVGNKHTFFLLEGAANDEAARGIYNEFLHSRLETHRKVFEVIGEKTKCQPTEGQLSGLGFSSTNQSSVVIRVAQGSKKRLYNVQIGGK